MRHVTFNCRWGTLVAAACLVGLILSLPAAAQDGGQLTFTKEYSNEEYGFSFIIPRGLTCYGPYPEAPNHGCVVSLGEEQKVYVWASYTETQDVSEYFRDHADLTADGELKMFGRMRISSALGGLKTAGGTFRGNREGRPIVARLAVALRRYRDRDLIIAYHILSICSESDASKCSAAFDLVFPSFTLRRLEGAEPIDLRQKK